jgi:hypothetical protein
MSASVSWVVFAIRRRSLPTRLVKQHEQRINANANSASCQLSSSMPTIVATTVVTFDAIDVAVFVTTFWTPPMSFEIRDWTSPVRVRVKKASDSFWRCRKTAARRSCMTRWPDLIGHQRLDHAEDAGHDRDRDHSAGGQGQRGRVVLSDRLEHPLEQERRHDAERRRGDDQQEQAPKPQPVGSEQAADPAQVRLPQSRVRGPLGRSSVDGKKLRTQSRVRIQQYCLEWPRPPRACLLDRACRPCCRRSAGWCGRSRSSSAAGASWVTRSACASSGLRARW